MQEHQYAVEIRDLVKTYSIFHNRSAKLKRLLAPTHVQDSFTALNGINANFEFGRQIGFVGLNGSGKSTLSTIIAGISPATSGSVRVNGSVSMLNTNVGLNPKLTGRETIYYKCLLLGFDYREIAAMEQDIIDFADIGMFIDQPVNTYSSGMRARLGFSVSIQVSPDILIVDEALSVGDNSFAEKCRERMQRYADEGKCVLFVSHSLQTMRDFCSKILWLDHGRQICYGDAEPILNAYGDYSRAVRRIGAEQAAKMLEDAKQLNQPD